MYDKLLYEAYGYLNEADRDWRALERKWKSSGNKEDAEQFVVAAKRAGQTKSFDYYRALWSIGQRPDRSRIYAACMMLSESIDQLMRALMDEGIPWPQVQVLMRLALAQYNEVAGMRAQNRLETLVGRGIQNTDRVTRPDLIELVLLATTVNKMMRSVLLRRGRGENITNKVDDAIDDIKTHADYLANIAGYENK